MKWIVAILIALFARVIFAQNENTIYDSNPNHLWNRLNKTLFERTAPDGKQYGLDELDILYWGRTTNLLAGTSHQQAIKVLNEFINSHGEKLIQDPLKKALLQRDLWALFDWAAQPIPYYRAKFPDERRELTSRLAIVIRRLELTTNEITALPDNYAQADLPDLPRGMFQTNGDWINITANNVERIVPAHDRGFGERSVFMVLFHDADGRKAGTNYLNRISSVKLLLVPSTNTNSHNDPTFNPAFLQFPTNSQWALARRMCVIDVDGNIQPTHIVESIQLRTYLGFGEPDFVMVTNQNGFVVDRPVLPQRFNEFRMTRPEAKIVSLARDEQHFSFNNRFFSNGIDALESSHWETNYDSAKLQNVILNNCMECHSMPGIYSVNSFTRTLSGEPTAFTTQMTEANLKQEEETAIFWKKREFEWGLLQGLWMQNN